MTQRKQPSRKTLVADACEVVQTCVGMNIRLAARRITQFLEEGMQAAGMTLAQFGLMSHIAAAANDTIGALAERTGLDQSTLSRNLRNLERDGLIEVAIVEADLRRRAVWLTEKGARRLETAIAAWRQAHEALAGAIDIRPIRKAITATDLLAGRMLDPD
jgi:DNA-binding MarR family transcriptional regulator